MKYKFKDVKVMAYPANVPMKDETGKDVTMLAACMLGLFGITQESNQLMPAEKIKRYKLGRKLMQCEESEAQEIELTLEDAATVKGCSSHFAPMVFGQIEDFFEKVE